MLGALPDHRVGRAESLILSVRTDVDTSEHRCNGSGVSGNRALASHSPTNCDFSQCNRGLIAARVPATPSHLALFGIAVAVVVGLAQGMLLARVLRRRSA